MGQKAGTCRGTSYCSPLGGGNEKRWQSDKKTRRTKTHLLLFFAHIVNHFLIHFFQVFSFWIITCTCHVNIVPWDSAIVTSPQNNNMWATGTEHMAVYPARSFVHLHFLRGLPQRPDSPCLTCVCAAHALPMFREARQRSTRKQLEKDRLDPRKSHKPEPPVSGPGTVLVNFIYTRFFLVQTFGFSE